MVSSDFRRPASLLGIRRRAAGNDQVSVRASLTFSSDTFRSLYFSYCLLEHIPQDVDLVFVELDINSNPRNDESIDATEAVFRTILALPNEPAIIYLSVPALSFDDMVHGWIPSLTLSQWFDIPMINIRNFVYAHLQLHPEDQLRLYTDWAGNPDFRHINQKAHVALGDMTIAYLREQLCMLRRSSPPTNPHSDDWPQEDITFAVPRVGLSSIDC